MSIPYFLDASPTGDDTQLFRDAIGAEARRGDAARPSRVAANDPSGDQSMVLRVRQGDAAAFEILFTTYAPRLAVYAYGFVRSNAVAEDLVQDVFLRLWEQRATWQVRTTIQAYLHAAVRGRALDTLKRVRLDVRHRQAVLQEDPSTSTAERPDQMLERDEDATRIQQALDELSDRMREAMALRWHGGLSYAEIANVMGISVRTVEHQLAAGLRHLRARLGESSG